MWFASRIKYILSYLLLHIGTWYNTFPLPHTGLCVCVFRRLQGLVNQVFIPPTSTLVSKTPLYFVIWGKWEGCIFLNSLYHSPSGVIVLNKSLLLIKFCLLFCKVEGRKRLFCKDFSIRAVNHLTLPFSLNKFLLYLFKFCLFYFIKLKAEKGCLVKISQSQGCKSVSLCLLVILDKSLLYLIKFCLFFFCKAEGGKSLFSKDNYV